MELVRSLVSANRALGETGFGGGIYVETGAAASQQGSTISGNQATTDGQNVFGDLAVV